MKRQLSVIAAAALLFSVASCNEKESEPVGVGEIKIALAFDEPAQSKAPSTAKPATSWATNIKDLTLVLTKPGVPIVSLVRNIPLPSVTGDYEPVAFTNMETGTWDVYVIANNNALRNPHVAEDVATAQPLAKGDDLKAYLLKEIAPGENLYSEPAEVFVAKSANAVTITEGATNSELVNNPLTLTRVVSLLRIRIDQSSDFAKDANFTHDDASVTLRRMSNKLNYDGTVVESTTTGLSSKKKFKNANPTTPDYTDTGMGITPGGFSLWNDYVITPGGHASSSKGFNLLITAWVPAGYRDAAGLLAPAGGGLAYWQATTHGTVAANEILAMDVTFTNRGTLVSGGVLPPPSEYGTMSIKVKLAEWGSITTVPLPM